MPFIYRSPYRPLDLGYAVDPRYGDGGDPVWDAMVIPGDWTPHYVYAFSRPLAERFVKQWGLVLITEKES